MFFFSCDSGFCGAFILEFKSEMGGYHCIFPKQFLLFGLLYWRVLRLQATS